MEFDKKSSINESACLEKELEATRTSFNGILVQHSCYSSFSIFTGFLHVLSAFFIIYCVFCILCMHVLFTNHFGYLPQIVLTFYDFLPSIFFFNCTFCCDLQYCYNFYHICSTFWHHLLSEVCFLVEYVFQI